jgi:hypothetical protein
MPNDYNANIINYIRKARRIIVEISIKQSKRNSIQRMDEIEDKPKDDDEGRIKGFIKNL